MSHGLVTDTPISRDELLALKDAHVHVIGAASAEGVAVMRLLQWLGFTNVIVHDTRPRNELRKGFRTTHGAYSREEQDEVWEQLAPILDEGRFADEYLAGIDDAALVVLGQGWYLDEGNRARIVAAVPVAARVTSMTDLYFALHRGPAAVITGTNGKSTTVALVEHLLQAASVPMRSAGNERSSRQFLPEIDDVPAGTWALLEISNRQLLQTTRCPQVAAITSLTPDHLDEHGGLAGYEDTKARLFANQSSTDDIAIANADDERALAVAERSPVVSTNRLVRCGIGDHRSPSVLWRGGVLIAEGVPLYEGGRREGPVVIASEADLALPGDHNRRNAAVAVAVALACGADPMLLAAGLRTFQGKALRLQHLDDIDGVSVWSDLKATTPEATIAALEALDGRRIVLVCGGDDKGLDYAPLARALVRLDVHALAVPGSATDKLERELVLLGEPVRIERVGDLQGALDQAFELAASGECVIVSPAAAGFWSSQLQGGASLRRLIRRRATTPGGTAR